MKLSNYMLVHTPDALTSARKIVAKATGPKGITRGGAKARPNTVGLWDLGAWLGGLPRIIGAMNRAQTAFVFFEAKAAVPVGLISRPEGIAPWLRERVPLRLGRKFEHSEEAELNDNIVADDYFELAEDIRTDLNIDYIIGITPSMVAGEDQEGIYWNHFSTFSHRTVLVSTYQLREFANKTHRPFEAFLCGILVAQLLVAKFYPKLGFHDNRGCLFDYNADRVSLMDKVSDLKIESECLKAITPRYRPAAQSLVDFLREFKED